jgi:hypothetical protein
LPINGPYKLDLSGLHLRNLLYTYLKAINIIELVESALSISLAYIWHIPNICLYRVIIAIPP